MKKTLIIFALFLLSIFTNLTIEKSYGRKPAVLPVSGISIDDLEPVTNDQAQGYEFKNEQTQKEELVKRDPTQLNQQMASSEPRSELFPALILFLILLPLGLWISVMKAKQAPLKTAETPVQILPEEKLAEVVQLNRHKDVGKESEAEVKKFPKAS